MSTTERFTAAAIFASVALLGLPLASAPLRFPPRPVTSTRSSSATSATSATPAALSTNSVLADRLGRRAPPPNGPSTLARQAAEYDAIRPKNIVELQKFRRSASISFDGPGGTRGVATLIDLNPRVNSWYLLHLKWQDEREIWYHLINANPGRQVLGLDTGQPDGIVVLEPDASHACSLWPAGRQSPLADKAQARASFLTLCGGAVLLPLRIEGSRTSKEWAADFLRDHVPGGEKLTEIARRTLFQDSQLDTGESGRDEGRTAPTELPERPHAARMDPRSRDTALAPGELGIETEGGGEKIAGLWYPVSGRPGVFVSAIEPGLVAPEVLASNRDRARELDTVERKALTFLVAFDLSLFDLAYSLGTDHPRVAWSERARAAIKARDLPGPDGIGELAPLVPSGRVPPNLVARTVATFVGGFKRQHAAFRSGALALVNAGSHYGFVQDGAVLSKLVPGLATLLVLEDGRTEMRTWRREDDAWLERIRSARQNGVPIVEPSPGSELPRPGALVSRWDDGNWSGSQDGKLRTLRASLAIQDTETRRFLVYAYFSGATPSAMARVLQAYRMSYAMPLDMNALEHTYFALYRSRDTTIEVEHLVRGMSVLEKHAGEVTVPRFLGYADNRDFFYVLEKSPGPLRGPLPSAQGVPGPMSLQQRNPRW